MQDVLQKILANLQQTTWYEYVAVVSGIASVFFSISIVATNNTASEMPMIRYIGGNPSRYIGIRNAKYTSASPVSFCIKENPIGISANNPAMICDSGLLKSVSDRERYFASASAVKILHVSTG